MIREAERTLPKSQLQQVVNRIERQSSGIDFDSLCVLASETVQCRDMKYGANTVRWQIDRDQIVTKAPQPEPITTHNLQRRLFGTEKQPFCISYGLGVDSTAVLIYLARMYHSQPRKCPQYRPDIITFADVGNEKKETYDYLPVIESFLKRMDFPKLEIVRYQPDPNRVEHGMYYTLEQDCLVKQMLPSWAYHKKGCSAKWKLVPQDKFRAQQAICQKAWGAGYQTIVAIGYDASPTDSKRRWKVSNDERYAYLYPLMDLGWDRLRCIEEIRAENLPGWETDRGGRWLKRGGVPVKSACWFCPSLKPEELVEYSKTEHGRNYLRAIIRMEENAKNNLIKIEGLWGTGCKGTRGGEAKPGRMTDFIVANNLLSDALPLLPILEHFEFECGEQCFGCH